jgi:hypothetical protein
MCRLSDIADMIQNVTSPISRFFLLGRFVVAKHGLPRHAAVRDHQRVEFLPPGQISPFAAEKTHHLQQIVDFRWAQRRLESWHDSTSLGDNPSDLTVAFSLYRVSEVRRTDGQTHRHRTITPATWSVTAKTALGIKKIHALVSSTAGKYNGGKENGQG